MARLSAAERYVVRKARQEADAVRRLRLDVEAMERCRRIQQTSPYREQWEETVGQYNRTGVV